MLTAMVIVFLVGYLMIALEHPLKINKAGTALLIGTVLWVMYTYAAPFFIPRASAEEFSLFLESFPSLGSLTFKDVPGSSWSIRFWIVSERSPRHLYS